MLKGQTLLTTQACNTQCQSASALISTSCVKPVECSFLTPICYTEGHDGESKKIDDAKFPRCSHRASFEKCLPVHLPLPAPCRLRPCKLKAKRSEVRGRVRLKYSCSECSGLIPDSMKGILIVVSIYGSAGRLTHSLIVQWLSLPTKGL